MKTGYLFTPTKEQKAKDEAEFGEIKDMVCPNCGLLTSWFSKMHFKCWECGTELVEK